MLAIVIDNIDNSYFSRALTKNLEQFSDAILFYGNLGISSYQIHVPMFNIEHLYAYSGKVLCCSKILLPICKHAPKVTDVSYYVWNLDWIHDKTKKYSSMKEIYQKTKLVARSAEQAQIIENTWNNKPIIVEDFKYDQLKTI